MPLSLICVALCLLVSPTSAARDDRPDIRLAGKIQDQTLAGLSGVTIRLVSLDRVIETQSAGDGSFGFDKVTPDVYEMQISAHGFIKQKREIDLRNNPILQPFSIVLQVGSIPDMETCGPHTTIKYQPASPGSPRLTGIVRDFDSGVPLRNIRVVVWSTPDRATRFDTNTNKMGVFTFQNLPAGHYHIQISGKYYSSDINDVLIPRENGVYLEDTALPRGRIVVCQ